MTAGAWQFTDSARTKMLNGQFNVEGDTYKMALFLSTSNIGAASTTYAGVTNEHAAANGYATGGMACDLGLSGTTTVKADIATDPVWTASGQMSRRNTGVPAADLMTSLSRSPEPFR